MEEGDRFLVADVGATKTLIYLAVHKEKEPLVIKKMTFLAEGFSSLEEILFLFLKGEQKVHWGVIGACGAVKNEVCHLTNLSWIIEKNAIANQFPIERVFLINDLELEGGSLFSLEKKDLIEIQKGKKGEGSVKALLSVGTGLGEAIVLEDRVLPTEGGHADFVSTTKTEFAFFEWMKNIQGHVSCETALSGKGVGHLYQFFSEQEGKEKIENIFLEKNEASKKAVSFFLNTLGREGGNFALKTLCFGGLYLSGGVLKKHPLILQRGEFLEAFKEKGVHRSVLKSVPIYLIKGEKSLILGGWNFLKLQKKAPLSKK